MSKEPIKDGFTAEKCNFQGVPGYTVKQWIDEACVCSNFIPDEHLQSFFDALGVVPVMVE